MPYQVTDDKKVTVRKILSMRNHWYDAALTAVEEQVKAVHESKSRRLAKELFALKRAYQQQVAAALQDPHPTTGAGLDDYVPSDAYENYFDKGLPAGLARQIKNAYDADMQNLVPLDESGVKEDMAIAFIRAANRDATSWSTIEALMNDATRQEYYLSTLTPINAEFDPTYDANEGVHWKRYGNTGLTSMNERIPPAVRTSEEAWRPSNFWYSELHVSDAQSARGEELFAGFRSGAFSAYAVTDKRDRKEANVKRALGVIEAMVIQKLRQLQYPAEFRNGAYMLPLTIVNIDLLSDASSWVKGDASMVRDHHRTLRALNGYAHTFTIKWPVGDGTFTDERVTANLTILDFNLAVNQASTFVLSRSQAETNQSSMVGLKNCLTRKQFNDSRRIVQLEYSRDSLQNAITEAQKEDGDIALTQLRTLTAKQAAVLDELQTLQQTATQIKELWRKIKTTATGEYVVPARYANLAYLLGLTVHFNCKSGKDRTGLLDVESKFLARELHIQRKTNPPPFKASLPGLTLAADESPRHRQMLWESGSLQILERNTRGQSLKVAELAAAAIENLPTISDSALRDRLGGNAMLEDLRGLADYTVLVDKMLK